MATCGQVSPRSSDGLPRLLQEPLRCSESTGVHSVSLAGNQELSRLG